MMKIPVNSKAFALIDDEDFSIIAGTRWYTNRLGYAFCNGKMVNYSFPFGKTILMHRLIMGVTESSSIVDHINCNGLDNRRSNLRLCTKSENTAYQKKKRINKTSRFRGVCFSERDKLWYAQIIKHGKRYSKSFKDEVKAARWYDKMAQEMFGKFASLNFSN